MSELLPSSYPASSVQELDELTYQRFRSETNQSQSFTAEKAKRLRALVSDLWKVPKAGPGDVVAGTRLEEVIGKGAFGTVWKGREVESGVWRAVKIFDADRLGDGLAVHLFRRGVRAMRYLRSQNEQERSQSTNSIELSSLIVSICEVEPHELAFSMDWIPNRDLSRGYIRGRSLDEKLRVFRHIARAIQYAHTRPSPIVHRDIKPQNIVMDGDSPILTDFDIADMAFAKTLSRRAVGGAFAYAAPEQLSEDCGHLEVRSDIYSLGRLLHFFLLESDPPLLIERNPPLEELNEYPEGIVKIIRRCTHRDLPMRYANVGELLAELDRYEEVEIVGAFGPNALLAQRHWSQAQALATCRKWGAALDEAAQAQRYIEDIDEQQTQEWHFRMLWWRLRAGELRLLPQICLVWFQRLSFPVALVLVLLALAPLAIPASRYISANAKHDKLEEALQHLTNAPSLRTPQAQLSLAYLQGHSWRLGTVRQRLLLLLSRARGGGACRYFTLLYLLAPKHWESIRVGRPGNMAKGARVMLSDIPGFVRGKRWGPIRCKPNSRFLWLHLTPAKKSVPSSRLHVELHIVGADLRLLRAEGIGLDGSQLKGADLRQARLNKSGMVRIQLAGAKLDLAELRGVRLHHSQLIGASFRFADLRSAVFNRANARFADFRKARLAGADFRFGDYQGALFDAAALPAMRKGRMHQSFFREAICLSGGYFFQQGPAYACHLWHRERFSSKSVLRSLPPRHCPDKLRFYSVMIVYPPGELVREGVCPWNVLPPRGRLPPTSRPTSKPTSRPAP